MIKVIKCKICPDELCVTSKNSSGCWRKIFDTYPDNNSCEKEKILKQMEKKIWK